MNETLASYTPISQAETDRVRFNLSLPSFVDQDQILVNLRRVHTMCQIGGIRYLRVEGDAQSEVSSSTPLVLGVDSSGHAFAGLKAERTSVPEFTTDHNNRSGRSLYQSRWVDGIVTLNLAEISEKIQQEKKWRNGLRSPDAWSHHLDKSLRGGITRIGGKHLMFGIDKIGMASCLFQYGFAASTEAMMNTVPSVSHLAFKIGILTLFFNFLYSAIYGPECSGRGTRLSLIYGPHFDRALLLKIMSLRGGLIRPISKSS